MKKIIPILVLVLVLLSACFAPANNQLTGITFTKEGDDYIIDDYQSHTTYTQFKEEI